MYAHISTTKNFNYLIIRFLYYFFLFLTQRLILTRAILLDLDRIYIIPSNLPRSLFAPLQLLLAILVLLYIPNSPKVVITAAGTWAASTALGSILLLFLFHFYCNYRSKYITR